MNLRLSKDRISYLLNEQNSKGFIAILNKTSQNIKNLRDLTEILNSKIQKTSEKEESFLEQICPSEKEGILLEFETYQNLIIKFGEWMEENEQKGLNWFMELLLYFINQFSKLADKIDNEKKTKNYKEMAESLIKNIFRGISQNRAESDSHPILYIYGLTVTLFKIYFKMKKFRLCEGLRSQLKLKMFPDLSLCPQIHSRRFYYYCGILDVMTLKFPQAKMNFEKAKNLCDKPKAIPKILSYLFPLNCLYGIYPSKNELIFYREINENLKEFVLNVKEGNIKRFNSEKDKNCKFFREKWMEFLFSTIENKILYRNFLNKIHKKWIKKCQTNSENSKTTKVSSQIPMALLVEEFKIEGLNKEIIEPILINLIFDDLIKGYISKERCLVLSKNNPFPQIGFVKSYF